MAGRASRGATHEELSAASGAACLHPEREWEVEAALRFSALEPVFEADFLDCWYGFRPGRNAHQALEEIRGHLQAGYQAVYYAGLKSYFDTISHEKLLACLRHRIADRNVLGLIRMWLEAVVVEPGEGAESGPGMRRGLHRPGAQIRDDLVSG